MADLYDKIVELARRRGFFWPSYEIYGGVAGFYDLGPLGVALKNKIVEKWRRFFVKDHSDHVVEIETPVIGPSRVYEASGHVESFTDPIVSCSSCGRKYRADHLVEEATGESVEGLSPRQLTEIIRRKRIRCPVCGGELGEVKVFNLLFRTQIGPYEGDIGYLRPELAQGMFVSFKRVIESMRGKLPIGIAQVGRVGRNEISPRQAMVRLREFTIMEMEYFIDPEASDPCPVYENAVDEVLRIRTYRDKLEDNPPREYTLGEAVEKGVIVNKCLGYWMAVSKRFVESVGVRGEDMFFEEKGPEERAHYSSQTFDQMVRVSRWGWVEVSGHSYRTDYDLSRHMKYSGADLTVFKSYPKPVTVVEKRIVYDRAYIGRKYRAEAPRVMEALSRLDPEEAERLLRERGAIEVEGYVIPGDKVRVVVEEKKVTGRRIVPHVVEPSFGVERVVYAAIEHAYREKEGRVILSLPRDIAPFSVVVLPLNESDEKLVEVARRVYENLVREGFDAYYDDSGGIGRRYARADEIGVPAAVTIDYQTLEDGTVTVRDRDSWRQSRVHMSRLPAALRQFIYMGRSLDEIGVEHKGEQS